MKLRIRFYFALVLFAVCATLTLRIGGSAALTGIENSTCEPVSPGVYRIAYEAPPHTGPVKVFASSRPDRIDSAKPLLTIRQPPANVSVPEHSGRVYFQLQPASGPMRVVSVRRLPLEGARNFRDLGGYRTADGRYVRWGLVYRSNYLANLTPKDYEYLQSLGIRLICDIRADPERLRSPTHWIGSPPEFLNLPIGPNRDGTLTPEELKRRVDSINAQTKDTIRGYDYAVSGAAQYGKILQRIAAGDLPLVEHDTSGKDRAGLFAAILLTALGVPRDVVIQDYLLTTKYMLAPDAIESTTADLQKIFGLPAPPDAPTVKAIMTTRSETLEATFDAVTKTYGSFDNYLRDALKVSDADLALLRQRLLEP
jgi:protein-tyrosine phosphatase